MSWASGSVCFSLSKSASYKSKIVKSSGFDQLQSIYKRPAIPRVKRHDHDFKIPKKLTKLSQSSQLK